MAIMTIMLEKFWDKINRGSDDECWVWDGGSNVHQTVYVGGRNVTVARLAWTLYHGEPPPDGTRLMKVCGNKRCINPNHMEVRFVNRGGGNSDNVNIFYIAGICGYDLERVRDGVYKVVKT